MITYTVATKRGASDPNVTGAYIRKNWPNPQEIKSIQINEGSHRMLTRTEIAALCATGKLLGPID